MIAFTDDSKKELMGDLIKGTKSTVVGSDAELSSLL